MTFSLDAQSEIIMDGVFDDWANVSWMAMTPV